MRRRLVVAAAVIGGRLQFRSSFSAACDGGSYNLIHKHKQWSRTFSPLKTRPASRHS